MAAKEGMRTIFGLYRQILRAHYKQLPVPMRVLGDGHVPHPKPQVLEPITLGA